MNLRAIHAILIFLSAALAVLFGIWCYAQYGQTQSMVSLAAAVSSFAVSLGLLIYDSWFLRKTRMLR